MRLCLALGGVRTRPLASRQLRCTLWNHSKIHRKTPSKAEQGKPFPFESKRIPLRMPKLYRLRAKRLITGTLASLSYPRAKFRPSLGPHQEAGPGPYLAFSCLCPSYHVLIVLASSGPPHRGNLWKKFSKIPDQSLSQNSGLEHPVFLRQMKIPSVSH